MFKRMTWWNSKEPTGFRVWLTDLYVIAVGIFFTLVAYYFIGQPALIIPWVLGHFFLFCNVFRVHRNLEITWGVTLIINIAVYVFDKLNHYSIVNAISVQLFITFIIISVTIYSDGYHGILATRIKGK